jgi:hypothetical protein
MFSSQFEDESTENHENTSNLIDARYGEELSSVHTTQIENPLTEPSPRPTIPPSTSFPCNDASQGSLDEKLREPVSATTTSCLEDSMARHFPKQYRRHPCFEF